MAFFFAFFPFFPFFSRSDISGGAENKSSSSAAIVQGDLVSEICFGGVAFSYEPVSNVLNYEPHLALWKSRKKGHRPEQLTIWFWEIK